MHPTPEPVTRTRAAAVLNRVGLFQGLDPATLRELAKELPLKHVRRGEAVYRQNDPAADALHVIITGKVKICCVCADGREQLMEVRGPSDVLGMVAMLDPGPRTATATAITDVCVGTVPRETVEMWLTQWPQLSQRLLRFLARRLQRADDHLLAVVFDDVSGRVAKELLQLAQRFGTQHGDSLRVKHDLTQTEIAQLVGATRESVNKALCEFAQRGWITSGSRITLIHRPELLARRAG